MFTALFMLGFPTSCWVTQLVYCLHLFTSFSIYTISKKYFISFGFDNVNGVYETCQLVLRKIKFKAVVLFISLAVKFAIFRNFGQIIHDIAQKNDTHIYIYTNYSTREMISHFPL